jgi:superfamily I DNA/RNA helicase
VAPPGTGKTSLAARLAAAHAQRLTGNRQVLLLTFSNQARGQLEHEVVRHVPARLRARIEVTNYHRFFWSLVRRYRRALGLPEAYRITSGARRGAIVRGSSPDWRHLPGNLGLDEVAELRFNQLRPALAIADERLEPILVAVEAEQAAGRLVFGDFGALWMRLMLQNPTVLRALRARYAVVIADEHQDASAVQDALVRSLGERHVVFADPMQLIHAWRGADAARLERHLAECDERVELDLPHRWAEQPSTGQWLLDVRARLLGVERPGRRPAAVIVSRTEQTRGWNAMLPAVRYAVAHSLHDGAQSVAVMAFTNPDVARVRDYLCRHGGYPSQVGLGHAFDRLVELPDALRDLTVRTTAERIIETLESLLPGLEEPQVEQARRRLEETTSRKTGCGAIARILLEAADHGYRDGAAGFFAGVTKGVDGLRAAGLHAPASDETRLYRAAAQPTGLDAQILAFDAGLASASHLAARSDRGVLTMTVHQSKGREFDAIVLVNATADAFNPADDERRRLFYVAITRARMRWEIIAPTGRETPLINVLGGL